MTLPEISAAARAPAEPPLMAKALRPLEGLAKVTTALAILCVLIFTLGQVADRYILKGSFNAYDQIARIGLIWMTFLGAALALRERANIVVDLIDGYLSPKVVRIKALILDALSFALMILLLGYAFRLLEVGAYQTVMGTPFTYREVYLALVLGSILFIVFLAARIVTDVISIVRPEQ